MAMPGCLRHIIKSGWCLAMVCVLWLHNTARDAAALDDAPRRRRFSLCCSSARAAVREPVAAPLTFGRKSRSSAGKGSVCRPARVAAIFQAWESLTSVSMN